MSWPRQPRVDAAPLVRMLVERDITLWPAATRALVGISGSVVSQIHRGEPVTVNVADRVACKVLGVHPCEVWGDDWWELP